MGRTSIFDWRFENTNRACASYRFNVYFRHGATLGDFLRDIPVVGCTVNVRSATLGGIRTDISAREIKSYNFPSTLFRFSGSILIKVSGYGSWGRNTYYIDVR